MRGLRLSCDRPPSWGVETWRAHLKKRFVLGDAPRLPLSRLRTSPRCKPKVRTDRDASGSSAVIISRSWQPQSGSTSRRSTARPARALPQLSMKGQPTVFRWNKSEELLHHGRQTLQHFSSLPPVGARVERIKLIERPRPATTCGA
jgi:hypothetical protein